MTFDTTTRRAVAPVVPSHGRLRPLGLDAVEITGGFWARRQETNSEATLAHIQGWLEREGWLGNFDLAAAGTLPAGRRGREFSDSEVYKYLEAVAWELARRPDPALEARFRAVVARVAAAQEADGYLNTRFGRPGQGARWSDLEWGHELYCLGHLFQAAVARARTAPGSDDGLLAIAVRAADMVCATFGDDGIRAFCGHAVIEPGLVELARVTGDDRYRHQAQLFVDRRGYGTLADIEWGRGYFQDDVPVRETTALHGHAVRANYLAAGAVDVAVEGDDAVLLDALTGQWGTTVARRTYITGGQGSHHQDEAFGEDFELPPDRAYSETCAGVASIMFSWRLLLAHGDARYGDLIERTLFNVIATSPSASGTSFYYANTLQQRTPGVAADPDEVSVRASSSLRAPWFEVSCCPPNVARTLASLASYVATVDEGGLQLHQYAPARIRTVLANGERIAVDVETAYPADGTVRVIVLEDASTPWALTLRVPSWADGARLTVRGPGGDDERRLSPGSAVVERAFRAGDVVELVLPVGPRIVRADPRIDAVRGCVAVERGPEVLCLESVDLAAAGVASDVADAVIDASIAPRESDGRVLVSMRRTVADDGAWPYGSDEDVHAAGGDEVALIPYHEWAERGPSTMRVWMPEAQPTAR